MQKSIVIVSHSLDETITRCIINNKKNIDANITIVSLQELMTDYEVFDEVSDSGTIIRWYKGQDLSISNKDNFLLNRVLYMPNTLFANFIKTDREYAQHEFEAYIGFSFNAFLGVGNQSATGACVESLCLPQQWQKIKKEFAINVPDYYWGPIYNNCIASKKSLVYSHVYNFLNWTTCTLTTEEHVFCFAKPQGKPVFVLSIGTQQLITSDKNLPEELEDRLKKLVSRISNYFNYFISETLIFVEGSHLNFGCINPEIIRSNKNSYFDNFVCNNLLNEFYKWMN